MDQKRPVLLQNRTTFSRDPAKHQAAFTLIELILVMSIAALILSMSLVALSRSRIKAQDKRITATLSQVRVEAALVMDESNPSSYANLCAAGTLNNIRKNLDLIKKDIEGYVGSGQVVCYASASRYCVHTPLLLGGSYCLDSSGNTFEGLLCDNVNIACQ